MLPDGSGSSCSYDVLLNVQTIMFLNRAAALSQKSQDSAIELAVPCCVHLVVHENGSLCEYALQARTILCNLARFALVPHRVGAIVHGLSRVLFHVTSMVWLPQSVAHANTSLRKLLLANESSIHQRLHMDQYASLPERRRNDGGDTFRVANRSGNIMVLNAPSRSQIEV